MFTKLTKVQNDKYLQTLPFKRQRYTDRPTISFTSETVDTERYNLGRHCKFKILCILVEMTEARKKSWWRCIV